MSMPLCLGHSPRKEEQNKKIQREVKMKTSLFGKEYTVNRCYSLDQLHIKYAIAQTLVPRTPLMALGHILCTNR